VDMEFVVRTPFGLHAMHSRALGRPAEASMLVVETQWLWQSMVIMDGLWATL